MKQIFLLFLSSFFLSSANPFFFGKWRVNHGGIVFTVDPTYLLTTMEEKGAVLRMRHTVERKTEENVYRLDLTNLEIVKPPSDWYNLKKYRQSLGMFYKLQKEDIKVDITVLDNDTLMASPYLIEDGCFILTRM